MHIERNICHVVGLIKIQGGFTFTFMKCPTSLAALTQVEYLEKKIALVDTKIQNRDNMTSKKVKDLFFQLGKAYSDLELMKRVQPYD